MVAYKILQMQSLILTSIYLFLHGASMMITSVHGFGFINTLPSYSSSSSVLGAPFDQLQRISLKKKLIKAAENKNEDEILNVVNELAKYNPTKVPTFGLLGYDVDVNSDEKGKSAPLNGAWKLLYTNAKDAEAPARTETNKDEQFGDEVASGIIVKTGQRINAAKGECINFIRLTEDTNASMKNEKSKKPFDELEITIQMTPLSDKRVRLDFVKGKALNQNAPLPFLKEFTFRFPPPAFGDILARLRGLDPTFEPQAYFDILYIDEEIRAHRTGEGKIFVQKRDMQ